MTNNCLSRLLFLCPGSLALSGILAAVPEPGIVLFGKITTSDQVVMTSGNLVLQFGGDGRSLVSGIVPLTPFSYPNNGISSYRAVMPFERELGSSVASASSFKVNSTVTEYKVLAASLNGTNLTYTAPTMTFGPNDHGKYYQINFKLPTPFVPNSADLDGDGLPDDWERRYGLDPRDNTDGNSDHDGDGMITINEYYAGTNPIDAQSVLQFLDLQQSSNGITIRFSSVAGKRYTIQRANRVDGEFTLIASGLQASVPVNTLEDTEAQGEGPFFYRLIVE